MTETILNNPLPNKNIQDVVYYENYGLMKIEHLDFLDWDDIQEIKNRILGDDVTVIEFYPQQRITFSEARCRFLWVLGQDDIFPNLSSFRKEANPPKDVKDIAKEALKTPLAIRIKNYETYMKRGA